jgi:hypothetical protein
MPSSLSPSEAAQLQEMIGMFEVIVESRPQDCESLDILKEAYSRLGRHTELLNTSKRLAKAYVQLGQISSAILEYESILQQSPADPDAQGALAEIDKSAAKLAPSETETLDKAPLAGAGKRADNVEDSRELDEGKEAMRKIFVDGRLISQSDFDRCWTMPDLKEPKQVLEPFIQVLADKQLLPLEKSLKLLCEKSRLGYVPLEKYDVDIELARSFSRDVCQRWSILPFDKMGHSILAATSNPFNKRAACELERATADKGNKARFLWYIASPTELLKILRKTFR